MMRTGTNGHLGKWVFGGKRPLLEWVGIGLGGHWGKMGNWG